MSPGIFLINSREELVEMHREPYESEDLLQRLLASYPQVLAGDQFDSSRPRRWLLIRREATIPSAESGGARWSIDHVFLDQDAVPTLVEVKRSTDTRIRREVVGQMLDYAANAVVYWPVDHLRAEHEARCRTRGADPDDEVQRLLGPEGDIATFWQTVKTNLQAGRVRLVFVADVIPPELRRVVEFLNQQMDPAEVLALEVRQYVGKDMRTLVPLIIGQTAEAQQRKGTAEARQWDEPQFLEELAAQRPPAEVEVARRLMAWAKKKGLRIWFGRGARSGSFMPVLDHGGVGRQLFSVYTYGSVEILFQYYKVNPPFDDETKRREMRERLNSIEGVSIPVDAIARRPSIRLDSLTSATALDGLLSAFDWFIEQVRQHEATPG
jgi:hypothetical protein